MPESYDTPTIGDVSNLLTNQLGMINRESNY